MLVAMVSANSFTEHPIVQAAIEKAKQIPFRRRDHPGMKLEGGKPLIKEIPEDLFRRYELASYRVYDTRLRMGYKIPKAGVAGQLQCVEPDSEEDFLLVLTALLLGFAYGLQYNHKTKGPCFTNIQDSVISLDSFF